VAYIKLLCFIILSISLSAKADCYVTSGADFLKYPAGARDLAVGKSFSLFKDDINAIHYNPAAASFITNKQILISYFKLINNMNHNCITFGYPLKKSCIGISFIYFYTPFAHIGDLSQPLGKMNIYDLAVLLNYGRIIKGFLAGINIRYIYRNLAGNTADAYACDIGIIKKHILSNLGIGISIKNFGSDIKFDNTSDKLPTTTVFSTGISLFKNMLLEIDLERYIYDKYYMYRSGIEYMIYNSLYLRIGDEIYENKNNFAFGVGLKYIIDAMQIYFDYGFKIEREFENIHAFTVKFAF